MMFACEKEKAMLEKLDRWLGDVLADILDTLNEVE